MAARMSVLQNDHEPQRLVRGAHGNHNIRGERAAHGNHNIRGERAAHGRRIPQGLLPLSLALLLGACSTVSLDESEPGAPPAAEVDILSQPLKVPALEAIRDTPERKL